MTVMPWVVLVSWVLVVLALASEEFAIRRRISTMLVARR